MNTPKWGFGMAPLKDSTDLKNRTAIQAVKDFFIGENVVDFEILPDSISWVKGIFNRVILQDQWDWFTVNMYLDYPSYRDMINIVRGLQKLRTAILKRDDKLGKDALQQLNVGHFVYYCDNYLRFNINEVKDENYLYILSRREEKDVLKIGMTERNIQKRVNEINGATGVLYPYSARKIFKVKDCRKVEREVHDLLSQYRIRKDREFFKIEYAKACEIIDAYLTETHQYYYD